MAKESHSSCPVWYNPADEYLYSEFLVSIIENAYVVSKKAGAAEVFISFYVLSYDFTENHPTYQTEAFGLSADVATIKKFIDSDITDEDFLKKPSIYHQSEGNLVFKKIAL